MLCQYGEFVGRIFGQQIGSCETRNTRPEMRQFDIINMSPYYPLLDFGGDYPRITILFGIANSFAFFSWIVGHKLYGCASSDKLRYQIAQ